MALTVATNTGALMAQAAASGVNKDMELSMERLSTGKRINGASDDAAGVAIASRLTSEIKGTNQAIRNAMDGQALIDTAEGAHVEVEAIMQRMRELAVQSSNGTNDSSDRANLQVEMSQLSSEIDRIALTTSWAGQNLLNGTSGETNPATSSEQASFSFRVGSGTAAADTVQMGITALSTGSLGLSGPSGTPTISNSAYADANADTNGALSIAGNKITFSGEWKHDDEYKIDINDATVTIKLNNADKYSDDAAGVSAQLKDAIDTIVATNTAITDNISATDNGDGSVSLAASNLAITGLSVKTDKTTQAVFSANAHTASDVITSSLQNGNTQLKLSGTWNATDTVEVKVNGAAAATKITLVDDDNYANTLEGVAQQLVDALEADDDTKMVGISYTTDGNGTILLHDNRRHTLSVENGDTIKLTGLTHEDDEEFDLKIGGIAVAVKTAADGYEDSLGGVANQIKDQILATTGLKHLDITANADGTVKINNPGVLAADNYKKSNGTGAITTLAVDSTNQKLTFGGTVHGQFIDGMKYTATVNGNDYTITANESDGFSNDIDGLAAQMVQTINDAGNLVGLTVAAGASGTGEVIFTDATTSLTHGANNSITLDQAPGSANAVTLNAMDIELTDANHQDGDKYSFNVFGREVNITVDKTDVYDETDNGLAKQLKDAIDALDIKGLVVTEDGTKPKVALTIVPVFGDTKVEPLQPSVAYSDGKLSIGGTVGSGDKISFDIEGKTISVQAFNTSKSDLATTIKNAIDGQNIDGLTATNNGDGTISLTSGGADLSVTTADGAAKTIETLDEALKTLNNQRAMLGAVSNRLDSTVNNLTNISSNLQAGRDQLVNLN